MLFLRGLLLALFSLHAEAAACRSPLNERFETPCAATLAAKGPVDIRRLGTKQRVTLVTTSDLDAGLGLDQGLDFGALMLFKYFTASPGGQSGPGVVLNRTAPLTIRKTADGGWVLWMAASPEQFPGGPAQLPAPARYEELQPQALPGSTGAGRAAYFAVVNFTTPSLPQEADWLGACALATAPGALPAGYELDSSAPFPSATLALYNEAGHQGAWTSECWVGVRPGALLPPPPPPQAAAQGAAAAAPPPPPQYIVDQAGSTPQAFPYADLRRWGVKQVVGGSLDCSSYLRAIPGGPWYDAAGEQLVAASIAANAQAIAAAHADGMQIFLSSDLFQFPARLLARYAANVTWPGSTCYSYARGPTCIDLRANATRAFLRTLFDEVKATFPALDGVVLRYGENSPCAEHQGNAPFDTSDAIASLQRLLVFLREELCVARNLTVLFRTWDTSTSALHANASFYSAVVGAVAPHPRLVFSIKHTALDFWRRVAVNPTLGVGRHQQVVEAEVAGMYAACGTVPLYIGDGLINGFAENSPPRGLAALFAQTALLGGVLTNHQCDEIQPAAPYFWPRLEQGVIAAWAADPAAREADVFDAYAARELGLRDAPGARQALRAMALQAMDAHLKLYTVAAFDAVVSPAQLDRPTANWLVRGSMGGLYQLDPSAHPSTCHSYNLSHCLVFPFLGASGGFPAALAEKDAAADAFAAINASAYGVVAPALPAALAQALRASTELGAFNARIAAVGWRVMALGWQGDRAGGAYNVSGIRAGIAEYDALWRAYRLLPGKLPGYVLPGSLFNNSFWTHPSTGQPGMDQSVDAYRKV